MAIDERFFGITSEVSLVSEKRANRQQREGEGPFFGQIAVFVVPPAGPVAVEIGSIRKRNQRGIGCLRPDARLSGCHNKFGSLRRTTPSARRIARNRYRCRSEYNIQTIHTGPHIKTCKAIALSPCKLVRCFCGGGFMAPATFRLAMYQPGPLLLFAVLGNPSGPTLREVEGCRRKNDRGRR